MSIANLIQPSENNKFYSIAVSMTQARTFDRESEPDIKIQCDSVFIIENPVDGLEIAFSPQMMDAPITADIHKEDNIIVFRGKIEGIWLQHTNTSSTTLKVVYGNGIELGHNHKSVDIYTVSGTEQTPADWTAYFDNLPAIQEDIGTINANVALSLPVTQATRHNYAYTAGSNLFASAITPLTTPCKITLEFACSVAGKLSAKITNDGDTQTVDLNEAVNLVAGALYKFDVYLSSGDTLNFTYDQTGTVRVARAIEFDANL